MNLVDRVGATSSRPQAAFRWITALSRPGVTYEEMADTSDGGTISFATLDAKLGSALTGVAPSDFLRQVQVKKAEALTSGAMVTGRQILWLVDRHFRMTESDRSIYDTEHIFAAGLRSDDLRGFISSWDGVLVNLSAAAKPADNILETLFLRQIRKSKRMEVDITHYDRLPPGHHDRCYEYLHR